MEPDYERCYEEGSTAARPADSPSVSQRRAALPEPAAATAATAPILAQITQASRKRLVVNVTNKRSVQI
ncbi:hypothetical protein PO909_017773 [Leuciscus waleckii]